MLSQYPDFDGSLHRSADGLINAARGMLTQRDDQVINALGNIDLPALVVVGEQDVHYRNAATYMTAKLPSAERVDIHGAGHLPNITHPVRFNRELRLFLNRLDG